ncbi:oxysterol-binding protein [Thecamonas trahens ATCC 50062]|uniref:Oxysterol-binding protein n=1 Tax=Thecamonas trahens ATCC 50062 TaxID=461836 RepID=A0A0L0D8B1_THETB|nr:oxysterol-binding protein [Thecamonas trahens ATCC 50062]KNC47548.1 oxysterol-binding protein [Thecamonas trahens ATCC 50062]|eukprot:XP_013759480.1 oxysterol-binding protein [Thecamonas trahens ATCC 50062]
MPDGHGLPGGGGGGGGGGSKIKVKTKTKAKAKAKTNANGKPGAGGGGGGGGGGAGGPGGGPAGGIVGGGGVGGELGGGLDDGGGVGGGGGGGGGRDEVEVVEISGGEIGWRGVGRVGGGTGDVIMSGWVKLRGTFQRWKNKWMVLKPGKLLFFRRPTSRKHSVYVYIHGCKVVEKPSRRRGFSFKIYHPQGRRIMSKKIATDHCVLRVPLRKEMEAWLAALRSAVAYADAHLPLPYHPKHNQFTLRHGNLALLDNSRRVSNGSGVGAATLGTSGGLANGESRGGAGAGVGTGGGEPGGGSGAGSAASERLSLEQSQGAESAAAAWRALANTVTPKRGETRLQAWIRVLHAGYVRAPLGLGRALPQVEVALSAEQLELVRLAIGHLRNGASLDSVSLPAFVYQDRSLLQRLGDLGLSSPYLASIKQIDSAPRRMVAVVQWVLHVLNINAMDGALLRLPLTPLPGEVHRELFALPRPTDDDTSLPGSPPLVTHFVAEHLGSSPHATGFYMTNRDAGFVANGSLVFDSVYKGWCVEGGPSSASVIDLMFLAHSEVYTVTLPLMRATGLPLGSVAVDYVGEASVVCPSSGLAATLNFESRGLFGGSFHNVSGRVVEVVSSEAEREREREREGDGERGDDELPVTPGGERTGPDSPPRGKTLFTLSGKWNDSVRVERDVGEGGGDSEAWELDVSNATILAMAANMERYGAADDNCAEFESAKVWRETVTALRNGNAVGAQAARERVQAHKRAPGAGRAPSLFVSLADDDVWEYAYANTVVSHRGVCDRDRGGGVIRPFALTGSFAGTGSGDGMGDGSEADNGGDMHGDEDDDDDDEVEDSELSLDSSVSSDEGAGGLMLRAYSNGGHRGRALAQVQRRMAKQYKEKARSGTVTPLESAVTHDVLRRLGELEQTNRELVQGMRAAEAAARRRSPRQWLADAGVVAQLVQVCVLVMVAMMLARREA